MLYSERSNFSLWGLQCVSLPADLVTNAFLSGALYPQVSQGFGVCSLLGKASDISEKAPSHMFGGSQEGLGKDGSKSKHCVVSEEEKSEFEESVASQTQHGCQLTLHDTSSSGALPDSQ